jgi:plastocyanin
MRKILFLGLGIILVAAACNRTTPPAGNSQTGQNKQSSQNSKQNHADVQNGKVEISLTASGFSPSTVTVKKGTTVIFKNNDTRVHWPASDPHPTHTDLPGFDALKGLSPGQTYSYTFTKVGRFKMHDHLNPGIRGTITVVDN